MHAGREGHHRQRRTLHPRALGQDLIPFDLIGVILVLNDVYSSFGLGKVHSDWFRRGCFGFCVLAFALTSRVLTVPSRLVLHSLCLVAATTSLPLVSDADNYPNLPS